MKSKFVEKSVQRICFTGPESSGKSTLARNMAMHFEDAWVPEFARVYLEGTDQSYTQDDLLKITLGQIQMEEAQATIAKSFLFCDTGPLVLKVWSEEKFGHCPDLIEQIFRQHQYDLYVLCRPDFPWEPDPLRENPADRDRLYQIYLEHLQQAGFSFVEIGGSVEERVGVLVEKLG